MRISLLIATLCTTAALATAPSQNCFVSFATLPEVDDPTLLILSTYREFLDKLGREKVSAQTFQEAAKGNPFAFPESADRDLSVLRSRLRDFEKLIESRKWNTPELRTQLQAELTRQAGLVETAKSERDRVSRSNVHGSVPFPGHGWFSFTPDGKWMVARKGNSLTVFNTETSATQTVPIPEATELTAQPKLSPDGKYLLFQSTGKVFTVPFENGKVFWERRRPIFESSGLDVRRARLIPTGSPKVVYALDGIEFGRLHRLDFESGNAVRIQFKGKGTDQPSGVIPGTDQVFMFGMENRTSVLKFGTPDAQGIVHVTTKAAVLPMLTPPEATAIRFTNDRKNIVWLNEKETGEHELWMAPMDGGPARLIGPALGKAPQYIELNPYKNEMYVLLPKRQPADLTLVKRVDLDTFAITEGASIPHVFNALPFYPPGGDQILTHDLQSNLVIVGLGRFRP